MEDVIQEIILRLPLKSVLRCKLLSKRWQAFISHNKYFRKTYLSRNKNSTSLLLGLFYGKTTAVVQDEPVRFLATHIDGRLGKRKRSDSVGQSLSFLGLPALHLWGSSKGFLLCSLEFVTPKNYFICNPINKHWISLPEPTHRAMRLTHGFISDGTNHTVVRTIDLRQAGRYSQTLTLEIFTSVSPHKWMQLNIDCGFLFRIDYSFKSSSIVTEEGLFIFPVILGGDAPRNYQALILFDQTKDQDCIKLLEFPLRPLLLGFPSHCLLGQSDGLVLYAYYQLGDFKVWQLTKREWSLKHSLTMNITVENYPEFSELVIFGKIPMYFEAFHPLNPHALFIRIGSKNFLIKLVANPRLEFLCDFEEQGLNRDSPYSLFPYSYGLENNSSCSYACK